MKRSTGALALALGVLLGGCASTTEDEATARKPLVLAALAAPCVGAVTSASPGGAEGEGARAEDLLLDLVTALSTESDVAYVLVPGPLLAPEGPDPAGDLAALGGALGSLSAQAVVALAPSDVEASSGRPGLEPLLEGLERDLPGHPGKAAYAAKRRAGYRVVALGPDGKGPEAATVEEQKKGDEAASDDDWTIAALGASWGAGEPPDGPTVDLLVAVGAQPALTAGKGGRLTLLLPPFVDPPHLWALVTIQDGEVRVSLRALDPATKARDLPPLRLQK